MHVLMEFQDDSQINWNLYFTGLFIYSLGGSHKQMDEYISRLRGEQHKTQVDFVRGVLRIGTIVALYDETALNQEQRKQLVQGLKGLVEKNLPMRKAHIIAFEEGGNYIAEEYFAKIS